MERKTKEIRPSITNNYIHLIPLIIIIIIIYIKNMPGVTMPSSLSRHDRERVWLCSDKDFENSPITTNTKEMQSISAQMNNSADL